MEEVIRAHTPIGNPYFRWFDTGDLQNQLHFEKIIRIAHRLPEIWFWLPTQEKDIVRNIAVPKNLIVRVSAVMIDGPTSPDFAHTSRIAGADVRPAWASLVASSTKALWYCPGELHETYNCGTCRACWDRDVKTVVYIER